MQDAFADGPLLLSWWYDLWIVVPVTAIVGLLTIWMLVQTSWTKPVSLGLKILAVVGVFFTGIVAFDRIGLSTGINDPEIFGYVSIVGAVVALVLSVFGIAFRRRLGAATASATETGFATETGMATNTQITPEDGTMAPTMMEEAGTEGADATMVADASEEDDATQVASGGDDSATIMMGGAAATQMITPREPVASLRVRTGSEAGQTFTLDADETTIGRSQGNTIILQDATISRNHARIVREAGGYVIEDLGSTSGTTVDGTRAERQLLKSGSIVRVGETALAFEVEGAPAAAEDARTVMASSGAPASSDSTMILGREETRAAAWFLVRKGNQAGRSFDLSGDSVTIGRASENGIQLDDTAASTSHALVRLVDNAYRLYDLGSSNGTRVNGQAVTGAALRDGSRILIGQSELAFTEVAGGSAPQAAAPDQGGQTMVMRPSGEKQGVLLVRSGPAAGQSFPLGEQETVIGREPGAGGAVINDSAVSRRHALVRRTPDGYAIFDLGSTGGTTVDGVALTGRELHDGDVVEIGTTELQFVRPQSS